MKFRIIYADCPWKYGDSRNYKVKNNPTGAGGASKHYKVMSLEELKTLPVNQIAGDDCFLFSWCTGPKMDWGIEVVKAWGFQYVTIPFVWIKMKNDMSEPRADGIGCYTPNNAEYILLGRKGKYIRNSMKVKQIIMTPKYEHSEKPDEARNRIVELIGNVPRIELFARKKVDGWMSIGNGIDGLDIKDSINMVEKL